MTKSNSETGRIAVLSRLIYTSDDDAGRPVGAFHIRIDEQRGPGIVNCLVGLV